MSKINRANIKKVLVLGSGALKIGEAGEFDYSGSQALKALKEDGIERVLVNPNIATVQTSKEMAEKIYYLPVRPDFVAQIIAKEKPDGIFLSFGGQTALNCGLTLHEQGTLEKYNVKILGTDIQAIKKTEDRALFAKELDAAFLPRPRSAAATTQEEALVAAKEIGYPVIIRSAYSLGGKGSGVAKNSKELGELAEAAFHSVPQILIEEYLDGWKEVEYEVVRDAYNNCITVCNMENVDPMGIHTGESIVVAPSQTLTNSEYQKLRNMAIILVRRLEIIGECNVQFALNPKNSDCRIIEVNARLSRSSALASKATGYPLAYIAAKLALGYSLTELNNSVNKITKSCFEPALDYIVIKMPRWDFKKFRGVQRKIGSQMQSVGEVMAIGRSFEEALQKGIRMLNIGADGLIDNINFVLDDWQHHLSAPTDLRIFAIARAFDADISITDIRQITKIDSWFLHKIKNIVDAGHLLKRKKIDRDLLIYSKKLGFSDKQIAILAKTGEAKIKELREKFGIAPHIKQIDTLAAEFPAKTNYLYTTYNAASSDRIRSSKKKRAVILGSGTYCIGSSVEFDWCLVNTVTELHRLGFEAVVINCNPETVSTDYDVSDKLYFEELTLERVMDIIKYEKPFGVIVSCGGQIPNNLAPKLHKAGVKILGTPARAIDQAEDRKKFSRLIRKLGIDQPAWQEVKDEMGLKRFASRVSYPVLVRPSYVLSGAAMALAFDENQLLNYCRSAVNINHEHPVVISKFISGAKEIELDAVAWRGELCAWAISEHVENAGVHSGDATLVLPPQKIYTATTEKILDIGRKLAHELEISGPFNIQFLAKDNHIYVIECNLRASRSFPFVSKVYKENFIKLAAQAILGIKPKAFNPPSVNFIGIKSPQFSFYRIHGADPILSVDMTSTGEVACFGNSAEEAFLKSLLSTDFRLPEKNILLSLGGDNNKADFLEYANILVRLDFKIYATERTADFFKKYGMNIITLYKPMNNQTPSVEEKFRAGEIDLFINSSDEEFHHHISDDYKMRRLAVNYNVPLITNIQLAKLFVRSLKYYLDGGKLEIKSWDEYS